MTSSAFVRLGCGVAAAVVACAGSTVQAQSFQVIVPPGAGTTISQAWDAGNGGIAVGSFTPSFQGFVWNGVSSTTINPAPGGFAVARSVSGNGQTVAGTTGFTGTAFRWTSGGGAVSIGTLPTHVTSDAWRISSDGLTIVGESTPSSGSAVAFRWTQAGGMLPLGVISGQTGSTARNVSADGSVIVGQSGPHAFRWTQAGGMVSLGTLAGYSTFAASAVSQDGSAVFGGASGTAVRPYKWTAATGIQLLPTLLANGSGNVWDVSDDGRIAIGTDTSASGVGRAVAWDGTTVYDLNTFLPTLGINLDGWTLNMATGVSADGYTLVGNAQKAGVGRAYVVTLPQPLSRAIPAPGSMAAFAVLGMFAGRRRRN